MNIHKVKPADSAELSILCQRIYEQHFLYLWTDSGAWYINKVYNAVQLKHEIADNNSDYFFYSFDNQLIGYLKVNYSKTLEGEENADCLEVERIYFLKEFVGKGFGKQLMNYAFDIAQKLNKGFIFLKLMDSSVESKAFYEKMGFQLCGTAHLDFETMLPEFRGMLVMKKSLQ